MHDGGLFAGEEIDRNRERFLRELLNELSGVLEETVGVEEASGLVAIVGNRIGETINAEYCRIAGVERLNVAEVAEALVDFKRRIEGGFSVESINPEKIVLVNTACPFGTYVEGRRSLCMMTSSVFGRIAARNLGYARVEITEAIAEGDPGCRVVVHLTEGGKGREYFG